MLYYEFPDYGGEIVPVVISLLETVIEDCKNKEYVLLAKLYQYLLARNWEVYENNINLFFKLPHCKTLLATITENRLSTIHDRIIANDILEYIKN